jgi:RHS repeat-associated protein
MGFRLLNYTGRTLTGHVGGNSVSVAPGGSYEFADICAGASFMREANAGVIDSSGGELVQRLNERAESAGCADRFATVPVPSSDGTPTDQPGTGGDSPQQQGAPQAQPSPRVEPQPTPYGGSGEDRQPTQALHDQQDPRPEGEVRQGVANSGATPAQTEEQMRRARRGEPPEGERRRTHTGDRSAQRSQGGDPVDLFSGRFALEELDLEVPAPFHPIRLERRYFSGKPYFGPLGYNWDHNWNVYLRELKDGAVARWTGELHEDVFTPEGGGYKPPRGVLELLEPTPGPGVGYLLRAPGGTVRVFGRPPGWSDAERIPLLRVTDRAGNTVALTYDAENRLSRVLDDDGRGLFFEYGDCGFLEAVRDHSGRRVTYWHDETREHLVRVTLPATPSYPDGTTTRYEYSDDAPHPAARHNIIRVIDPDKQTITQIFYGDDPSQTSWNRVVRQIQGGYQYELDYEMLQWLPNDPLYRDEPCFRTTASYPDGSLWTHTFNSAGDLIDDRFRLVHDGSYRVVVRKMRYDTQGNLAEETAPDGSRTRWTYDDANPDPRCRGNLLKVERLAAPTFPVPSRILARMEYEPRFQLLRRVVHENGSETRYRYDLDLTPDPANIGVLRRVEWPDCTLPDGTTQSSVSLVESNTRGQPTAMVTPEGARDEIEYYPAGSVLSGFRRRYRADVLGADEVTLYAYDAAGYPAATTGPGGYVTRFEHDALGRRIVEILPEVAGVADRTEWQYHWHGTPRRIRRPRGEYSDAVITDPYLEERVDVDPLGHVTRRVVGANTAAPREHKVRTDFRGRPIFVTAPDGAVTRTCFDERGLMLFETRGESTPEALTTRWIYDLAGRTVQARAPGDRVTKIEHDPWGREAVATFPNGSRRRTKYGAFDLPTSIEIEGPPGDGSADRLLRRTTVEYDERGRPVRTSVWRFEADPTTAVPLTEIKWYDRDGRCVRRVTPTGGEWIYAYDGRGRLTSTTDAVGNVKTVTYGADGLPSRVSETELGPGGPLLRFTDHEHDARGRLVRAVDQDGLAVTTRYDARDLAVEVTDAAGVTTRQSFGLLGEAVGAVVDPTGLAIAHTTENDLEGRPVRYVDPTGEATTLQRDVHGRIRAITLANGRIYRRFFAAATGDLVRVESADGSAVDFGHDPAGRITTVAPTAGAGRLVVSAQTVAYDGLDRAVRIARGAEAVTRIYDSLDRLLSDDDGSGAFTRTYDDLSSSYQLSQPDGRRERHELDALGRVAKVVLEDPGTSALAAASAPPGATLIDAAYRGTSRVARLDHESGARSSWTHDVAGCLLDVELSGGGSSLAAVRYRLDETNRRRLIQRTGPIGSNTSHAFDHRGRLTRTRSGYALAPLSLPATRADALTQIATADAAAAGAPSDIQYTLDDADGRSAVQIGASTDTYTYAPAHELAQINAAAYTHDADGCRTAGDGKTYTYDALGRLCEVADGGGALATLTYDPAGRLASLERRGGDVERYRYLGDYRLRVEDGGGALRAIFTQHPNLRSPSHVVTAAGRFDLHYDGHEDLVLVTDRTGAAHRRVRFADFGAPEIFDGVGVPAPSLVPGVVPVWGGMRWIDTAALYFTPRRPYDARSGLFLCRDPFLYFSSANPYVFAQHDPIDGIDPDGALAPLLVAGLVVGLIGGIIGAASVVIRGGDYDGWDVLAGFGIGFGAGFIGGVTFGAAAEFLGGAALGGATAAGLTGTATGTAATATGASTGVSLLTGLGAGSVSGLASGTFSGFANATYQWSRHGGDYGSMVLNGVLVEGTSGVVGGAFGGALFAGALRVGALPTGFWASLSGQSSRLTLSQMAPSMIARGLASPYGLGAAGIGFGSGYTSGVTRRLLTGESAGDAFSNAWEDGAWGAGASVAGAALHPTTWMYWRARFSPTYAARIEAIRGGGAHHQRNVAQYPELATPDLGRTDLSWFERFYGEHIIGGNLRGRFSEYANRQQHIDLHNLWRFGQRGSWTRIISHGPWTPPWPVYVSPGDPRTTSHAATSQVQR